MLNRLRSLASVTGLLVALAGFVVLPLVLLFPDRAQADRPMTTTFHHSFCKVANGASQSWTDDKMQRMVCGAVVFWNKDDVDTVYVNINNNSVPAVVGCDDVVIVPPGMFVRHEVYRLKKIQYISDGTAEFYTSMDLWEN